MAVCTMYEYLYPSTRADWPSPGKNSLASPASKKAQHTSMTPLSLNGRYKYLAAIPRTGEAFFSSSLVIFLPPSMGQGLGSCWAGRTSQRPRREMPQPCWCEYLVLGLDLWWRYMRPYL
ncbi:hypothetical protein HDV62DRAFT_331088 [Trichoderma sp. SZMC 28011]